MKTPLENRADIDSLDQLHEQRRTLLIELAPLRAMHGSFGMYDARRKALVSAMKVKVRLSLAERGGKITDDIVDAEAHVEKQYTDWLDEQLTDKVAWVRLETEYDTLCEKIKNRELSLLAFNAEARLQR